ncbi:MULTISPECIES: organic hydroperoxide resistance protein [Paenibacillus]|uniref:Organic hydroperoxide resistance protein n=1 Tax=Paenibacillus lignilyticus TaxID=1172615 RepID=A0ABS5CHP0_9BACL|nr:MULTISPECIES: organic hydroperoxide resistance protein [Paenibacillus]MBP3965332.1 organic hydroperoxide resistance protein [Paenibacillus lignilyticus]SFT21846.1 peroxiredoxin, Ohr subfamily [Paenibacillus sp. BC26]
METLYTAIATVEGGRNGRITSSDGVLNLDLRMPKSLGGNGEEGTNPEQLFAAGYSACFDSALNLVARSQKVQHAGTDVTAHVGIGKDAEGGFELAVQLHVNIDGVDQHTAEELVKAAKGVCPYSKATRGNIETKLVVNGQHVG